MSEQGQDIKAALEILADIMERKGWEQSAYECRQAATTIEELRREVERLTEESDGRRRALLAKSYECRKEWIRAENAEGRAKSAEQRVKELEAAIAHIESGPC